MPGSNPSAPLKSSNFFCQIDPNPPFASRNPPNTVVSTVRTRSWRLLESSRRRIWPFAARFWPRSRRPQVREEPEALEFDHKLGNLGSRGVGTGNLDSRSGIDQQLGSSCSPDTGIGIVDSRSNRGVKLENVGSFDAGNGNVEPKSNFYGGKGVVCPSEMSEFWGLGTGPIFKIYEDLDGKVVRVAVDEDEIFARSKAGKGKGFGNLELELACARAMAKEIEKGERMVRKNSSLFEFVAVDGKKSSIVDAVVSVGQRHEAILRNLPQNGFSLLCGCCIVWVAFRLIWGDGNTWLSRKEAGNCRRKKLSRMKSAELAKSSIKMLKNSADFADDSFRRPQLSRKELMNNIKQAKAWREILALSFVPKHINVIDGNGAKITKIWEMVSEVRKQKRENSEQNGGNCGDYDVFSDSISACEEEAFARNHGHTQLEYIDNASDGRKISGIICSCSDKVEESMEHAVDLKNCEQSVEIGVNNLNGVQEIERSECFHNVKGMTEAKDNSHMIYAARKGAHIGLTTDVIVPSNNINTLSSHLKNKEALADTCVNNLDYTQEIEPSRSFSSHKQMTEADDIVTVNNIDALSPLLENEEALVDICANNVNYVQEIQSSETLGNDTEMRNAEDDASNINALVKETNVVSETADNVIPNDTGASSSDLEKEGALVEISANNLKCIQAVEQSEQFGSEKQPTGGKDIADDTTTPEPSDLKDEEKFVELRVDNLDCIQEIVRSRPFRNEKQVTHAKDRGHKTRSAGEEAQLGLVADDATTLDSNISSSYVLSKEETSGRNEIEISTLEETQKRTSSKKSFVGDSVKSRRRSIKSLKEGTACLPKKQEKPQKDVCSHQEAKTTEVSQVVLGSNNVINPSNNVQKAKSMTRKRLKKVHSDQGVQTGEIGQEVLESSAVIDPPNNVQNAKRLRRKQLRNADCNQGGQTRELAQEDIERNGTISLSEYAQSAAVVKPPGATVSSVQGRARKDAFPEAKANEFSVTTIKGGETKPDAFQTLGEVETGSRAYNDEVVHERSINPNTSMQDVSAAKKSARRKSPSKSKKSHKS